MAISNEMNATGGITRRDRRRGVGFLIEALVVLAFLMLALAVFVRLFSSAQLEGMEATQLSEAIQLAANRAEEFSANPTGVATSTNEGALLVTCDVQPHAADAGILYEATIVVRDGDTEVYTLTTSRYVSRGGAA